MTALGARQCSFLNTISAQAPFVRDHVRQQTVSLFFVFFLNSELKLVLFFSCPGCIQGPGPMA